MKNKIIFALALAGILAGSTAAYFFSFTKPALPPVYNPASDPYASGIYAEGIVESVQSSGENINVYPEVPGTVKQILVSEGQEVKKGAPLLLIDPSIQLATTKQLKSSAEAAHAMLEELRAEPRKETLDVNEAQVVAAEASLKTAQDDLAKQQAAYEIDPKSVSKQALDDAINAEAVAQTNLLVAQKQRDLTKAGAWTYDIRNQERTYNALENSYLSSSSLLGKYTLRAPADGIVLSLATIIGAYVSPQGAYDSYTQGMDPVIVLGSPQSELEVRCYVDEILVPRLPDPANMKAQMSIRGSDVKIALRYYRTQPYVSPKIELSDEKQELVDVRVLPVIFKADKPKGLKLYPGELVDVYIGD
jgi:HlyD family secretion protein